MSVRSGGKWWVPLMALVIWAIALRVFSFFLSVINHDESTYLVIAEGMLQGGVYFVDLIDTKPVGIFLLYAGMLSVVGKSIVGMRFLTALFIGFTAYGLFRLTDRAGGSQRAAWAAGLIYPLLVSIFTFYGVSPNTEIYFNLFTIIALNLIWAQQASWRFAVAGLFLGLGFLIKYVVFFDGLALGIFLLWGAWQSGRLGAVVLRQLLPLVIGAATPFVLAYAWYYAQGLEDTFLFYTFTVMGRYPVDKVWWKSAVFVLDFLGRFFPITLLAYWRLREPLAQEDKAWLRFLLLWMAFDVFAALYTGKLFGHYFIPLMLGFSLLAGGFFHPDRVHPAWIRRLPQAWGQRLIIVLGLLLMGLQFAEYYRRPDRAREVAQWLEARLQPGEGIYTGDYHQVIYLLLNRQSPTPYVHRSLVWDPHHQQALGINLMDETKRILAHNPRFVLLQDKAPDNQLKAAILQTYKRVHTFDFGVEVYERSMQ